IGVAVWWWRNRAAETKTEAPKTAKVERGRLRATIAATGRIVANLEVEIKCKASGTVMQMPFDVSDEVKKGDLILQLDPVDEERSVRRAEIALAAAQARLAQARTQLAVAERNFAAERQRAQAALEAAETRARDAQTRAERVAQLLAKGLASAEENDSAQASATQAAADLLSARARLEEVKAQEEALEIKRQDVKLAEAQVQSETLALSDAQQRLRDTQVYAPMDGIVVDRRVQIGQIISSGISNVGGGTTAMTLADLSRVFAVAHVDESDVGRLEVGQEVEITADAYHDRRFRGKVVRIAPKGANVSNVVTFEAKIEILGEARRFLKPEMTANVEIIVADKDNAIVVPTDAVEPRGRRRVVNVRKADDSVEEREVKLGASDGVRYEVLEGLQPGEEVLLASDKAEGRWSGANRQSMGIGPPPPMMFGGRRR
ncbi:MAG: efflux RND transporter periplasmic adaptor subunit, partial [Planctomycetota bacterium]|nr:efflux RND transporter periplasmic adaptor subunit [Planctomycetota bacterium]